MAADFMIIIAMLLALVGGYYLISGIAIWAATRN